MAFSVKITNTDNAAFGDTDSSRGEEVARILREVAKKLDDGEDGGVCMDYNGNKVGEWSL